MAATRSTQVLSGTYENHVLPFLWLRGESHESLTEYLEAIAAADIHEVCLESRPHPDFCGDGWWADLAFIIDECKRLGMGIWILDDAHFPTGYANGLVEKSDPALRKTVLKQRVVDVVGPTPGMSVSLANPFDKTETYLGAALLRDGRPIDGAPQPLRDGNRLIFDAPEGVTQLHLYVTSTSSGHNDNYINMVDKASCDLLIKAVYEPHYAHFSSEFGRAIRGFFTDEPGFMNEKGATDATGTSDSLIGKPGMPLPWSAEVERRLRERWGEAFLSRLAQLWARDDAGAGARHDFMDVATALYRECFDENLGTWCRERGVMHIGHVIEDKGCHERLGVGAGHYFRAVAGQDMAGVDVVINQLVPGMDEGYHSYGRGVWDMEFFTYVPAKLGSSAAHLDPRKGGRCMAEVFGAFGWHEGLREMTWIANHFLVRGVNWFVPHAFSQAPFPDFDCPPHFYAHGKNPQFRHFGKLMTYLNRMGTLLSGGRPHPTAAVLYSADAAWAGDADPMQHVCRELARHQIDFDLVPEDAFADTTRYQVVIGNTDNETCFSVYGQAYRCLVIPRREYVGAATQELVERLGAAGVTVLATDELPRALYDGTFVAGAWAGTHVIPLAELADEMRELGLYDVLTSGDEPWLRAYHYTPDSHGDSCAETYYLLVNEHPKRSVSTTVSVLCDGKVTPLTGMRHDVLNGGAQAFDGALELAPYEACLVVSSPEGPVCANLGANVARGNRTRLELAGSWHVSFSSSEKYPKFANEHELTALVDLSRELYPQRAGTFRYELSFTTEKDLGDVTLSLGEVYETAEAWLDGSELGVRLAPPYVFSAGTLAAGTHALAVEVTNTLDHEVFDIFSMTEASEPSGLLGPVALEGCVSAS